MMQNLIKLKQLPSRKDSFCGLFIESLPKIQTNSHTGVYRQFSIKTEDVAYAYVLKEQVKTTDLKKIEFNDKFEEELFRSIC